MLLKLSYNAQLADQKQHQQGVKQQQVVMVKRGNLSVRLHRHDKAPEHEVPPGGAHEHKRNVDRDGQNACQEDGAAHIPEDRRQRSLMVWLLMTEH